MSPSRLRLSRALALLLLALLSALGTARSVAANDRLVVVELFTSQGCASCPPADLLIHDLARQPGLLVLSMHVPYWDRLGWRDPFALKDLELRQRAYLKAGGQRSLYTPQVMVQGSTAVVGNDRGAVEAALRAASRLPGSLRLERESPQRLRLHLLLPATVRLPARAFLIAVDREGSAVVTAGENTGHQLRHVNVVRAIDSLDAIEATETSRALSLPEGRSPDFVVVLVHADPETRGLGPIVAAARMDLKPQR